MGNFFLKEILFLERKCTFLFAEIGTSLFAKIGTFLFTKKCTL